MKILLAFDGSDSSEAAVRQAASRPWPEGTRICVLNVVDLFTFHSPRAGSLLIDAQVRAGEFLVKAAADRLSSHGLEVESTVIKGYPPSAIVDYAKEWGADFIIIGSQSSGTIRRFLLGSVAQVVLRHAHCSVEIVRQREEKASPSAPMKILLATDGSEFSLAAARSIAARPWPERTEVKVVCVLHMPDPMAETWEGSSEAIARIESEYYEEAEEDVTDAEKLIKGAGLKVTSSVLEGYPKAVILDEADRWRADLIVVGSHGRRGVTRLVMGSVSEAIALYADCSVEVIRKNKGSRSIDRVQSQAAER
jgi:nucleotide-binding universal stress UspA family protein